MAPLRIALAVSLLASSLAAQQTDSAPPVASADRFAPGALTPRVASTLNRAQQYAVYLPSGYRTDRKWPVLLLLDPRGRALLPMRLAQASAERFGYVVLSSWNTLSDWDNQPNIDAMSAMLTDLQRIFAFDPSRIYIAGFSGTARFAWEQGSALRGSVAGVLGFGAGVPPGFQFIPPGTTGPLPFDYFGGAGTLDFNYEELLKLDQELDRQRITHRIRFYDGPHSWPPERVMAEGIEWIELRAMGRKLAPVDSGWVDSLFARSMERAETLARAGDSTGALREYRSIVSDFGGLRDVAAVVARSDMLARSKSVKAAAKAEAAMIRRNREYLNRLVTFLRHYRTSTPPSTESSLKTLEIARLLRERQDQRDTVAALAAGRLLSHVQAAVGFYEPRDYLVEGDSVRALALLQVAQAVHPNSGRTAVSAFRDLVAEIQQRTP
jgi:predicted esterase